MDCYCFAPNQTFFKCLIYSDLLKKLKIFSTFIWISTGNSNLTMKRFYSLLLCVILILPSCSRTPERILLWAWDVNVSSRDHQVEFFKDQQYPNGDVSTVIRMKVALNDDDISKLISKGARHLPIEEKTKKGWLERISGLDGANNGVYFFEQGEQELECKFLIYDRDSQVLYYYLSIM